MPVTIFRACLLLLWSVVALAKITHPNQFLSWIAAVIGVGSQGALILGWTIVVGEAGLGGMLAISWCLRRRAQRVVAGASWTAAAIAALVTVVTRDHGECGCFGALVDGTLAVRLIVAGSIMWLSFELHRHIGRSGSQVLPSPRSGASAGEST